MKALSPPGLVGTLNFGIKQARSNWIARIDADDICLPNRLKAQVEFVEKNPDIVILGTGFEIFGTHSRSEIIRHPTHPVEVAWKFSWNTRVGHPTVLFNKKTIEDFGGYPKMKAEDFALFSKIAQMRRVSNLPGVFLKYRLHGENKSVLEDSAMREDVYTISSQILASYNVPRAIHKAYVHFHWGVSSPLKYLPTIYLWNFIIIGKISLSLGYSLRPSFVFVIMPKFIFLLISNTLKQVRLRLRRYRLLFT